MFAKYEAAWEFRLSNHAIKPLVLQLRIQESVGLSITKAETAVGVDRSCFKCCSNGSSRGSNRSHTPCAVPAQQPGMPVHLHMHIAGFSCAHDGSRLMLMSCRSEDAGAYRQWLGGEIVLDNCVPDESGIEKAK